MISCIFLVRCLYNAANLFNEKAHIRLPIARPCRRGMQCLLHYSDVIMSTLVSEITGISIVCSTVCLGADRRIHQSSASLAFVRGNHR